MLDTVWAEEMYWIWIDQKTVLPILRLLHLHIYTHTLSCHKILLCQDWSTSPEFYGAWLLMRCTISDIVLKAEPHSYCDKLHCTHFVPPDYCGSSIVIHSYFVTVLSVSFSIFLKCLVQIFYLVEIIFPKEPKYRHADRPRTLEIIGTNAYVWNMKLLQFWIIWHFSHIAQVCTYTCCIFVLVYNLNQWWCNAIALHLLSYCILICFLSLLAVTMHHCYHKCYQITYHNHLKWLFMLSIGKSMAQLILM